MPFFIKQTKAQPKRSFGKNRKENVKKHSKNNEEISGSEDESQINASIGKRSHQETFSSCSDDERETIQEKKLRLAKEVVRKIEEEEKRRLQTDIVSSEVIGERLKTDYLKKCGKYKFKSAHQYSSVKVTKILKCKEQFNTITCICLSSDDKWIYSGSKNGVVIKWSREDGKKIKVLPFSKSNENTVKINGHSSAITCIAVSFDQKYLVIGDCSNVIQVWNPENFQHICSLKGHRNNITGVCIKGRDHILYSTSSDNSVRVWSLDEQVFIESLFGHEDMITYIDVLNNECPITAGGRDGTIRIWKIATESQIIYNTQPKCVIDCVKYIDEQHFVSGDNQGYLSIWHILKKKPICTSTIHHDLNPENSQPYWVNAVTVLPNSDLIASGTNSGYVKFWKIGDGSKSIEYLFQIQLPGCINCLTFTSDGKQLIAGCGREHRLGRWNTFKTGKNCVVILTLQT